jgi:hypothetical protein
MSTQSKKYLIGALRWSPVTGTWELPGAISVSRSRVRVAGIMFHFPHDMPVSSWSLTGNQDCPAFCRNRVNLPSRY